jgi:hypothetical protein
MRRSDLCFYCLALFFLGMGFLLALLLEKDLVEKIVIFLCELIRFFFKRNFLLESETCFHRLFFV